jgi:hypothetical protein
MDMVEQLLKGGAKAHTDAERGLLVLYNFSTGKQKFTANDQNLEHFLVWMKENYAITPAARQNVGKLFAQYLYKLFTTG